MHIYMTRIYIYIYIYQVESYQRLKKWYLMTSGRVLASIFCGWWFDLQWWKSQYALLMRTNKVETVPYVSCRCLLDFLVMIIQI